MQQCMPQDLPVDTLQTTDFPLVFPDGSGGLPLDLAARLERRAERANAAWFECRTRELQQQVWSSAPCVCDSL